jgi:hypothetical protein
LATFLASCGSIGTAFFNEAAATTAVDLHAAAAAASADVGGGDALSSSIFAWSFCERKRKKQSHGYATVAIDLFFGQTLQTKTKSKLRKFGNRAVK